MLPTQFFSQGFSSGDNSCCGNEQALSLEVQALRCSLLSQVTAHNFITTQLRQSFLVTIIVQLNNVDMELEAFIEQRREANY
jgi:hypothetical protein